MDFQTAFNIAVGLVGFFGGWYVKSIADSLNNLREADTKLTDKVQHIEVLVAGQYVRREDLHKHMDDIFSTLRRIEEKLDGKADKKP